MCASVAIPMVVAVGVSQMLRRRWRATVLHTVPLVCVYVLWFLAYRHKDRTPAAPRAPIGAALRFARVFVGATFHELGHVAGVGLALGVVSIIGFAFAWRGPDRKELRRLYGAATGLVVGALFFTAMISIGRGFMVETAAGDNGARQGRYYHVLIALLLPALAIGASAIARRWHKLLPLLIALFLLGIPGNMIALARFEHRQSVSMGTYRDVMLLIPRLPLAKEVPRSQQPDLASARPVTIGWLLDGLAAGRIPAPHSPTARDMGKAILRTSLRTELPLVPVTCHHAIGAPVVRHLATAETITWRGGPISLTYVGPPPSTLVYGGGLGNRVVTAGLTLRNVGRPMTVQLARPSRQAVWLCQ
jgi:hypothetical protein